ncbi:hypothetical protein [Marinimicrobium locisalis]|uniref:hypothetical protein n=1 Tax=Marinimicrobium locisalis TaxID=546022 RepID=UPI003221947C
MSTFPPRYPLLLEVVDLLMPQVDQLNICLNGYESVPEPLKREGVNAFVPEEDFRDVGKFVVQGYQDEDDIFYVDDDIFYPGDYVQTLLAARAEFAELNPVVGVHGVIYPDAYRGAVGNRKVFSFPKPLGSFRVVNQLGTGTVHCKGFQAAPLSYMQGSQRFVDARYARYALAHRWPMVCIPRQSGWMAEFELNEDLGESIFQSFTKLWPIEVIRECQTVAGYSKLSLEAVLRIENPARSE